jgi:hypothetical protein
VEKLLQMLRKPGSRPASVRLKPEMLVRESAGPPPARTDASQDQADE